MLKKELLNNSLINNIDDFCYTETETNSYIINPDIILSFENSHLNSPSVFTTVFNAINRCSETEDYDSEQPIMNTKLFYKLKYNIVLYDLINTFLMKKIHKIEYIKNKCIFNFVVTEVKDRRKMREYRLGYKVWASLIGRTPEF